MKGIKIQIEFKGFDIEEHNYLKSDQKRLQ